MTAEGPAHAGVLVPWANTAVEAELHRVTGPAVTWHYARLVPASRTTRLDGTFLAGLLGDVPSALGQLAALPLARAYLACTSAAFMYPQLAGQAAGSLPGGTLVTAFDAIIDALSILRARRVVLLTPYPADVTQTEADMLAASGITVTARACLGLDDGYGSVTGRQVADLLRSIGIGPLEEADAVVLSCTGWPTLDLIPDLQRIAGRPVLSSNLAIGQHALRKEAHAR